MGVPLLLPRRERVQRELSGWFGDKFEQVEVAATYNLILNAANMIRNGVGVALGVLIGNLTNELKFIPLSPPMETGSVLGVEEGSDVFSGICGVPVFSQIYGVGIYQHTT